MDLAIIFCCYNRKNVTLHCLEQLYKNINAKAEIKADIYVVDDGSTDGTSEEIEGKYPEVVIMQTGGDFYWSKSMYMGMKRAFESHKYDFFLMVNDDVDFYDDMLKIMFESYYEASGECAIVGSTEYNGKVTYGGRIDECDLLKPNGEIQECYFANWNCFLLPSSIIDKIGFIDGHYRHAYGDYDYSIRMRKKEIPIYTAIDYVGSCAINLERNKFADAKIPRAERLKALFSPKGIPFISYMRYSIRMSGVRKIKHYLCGYVSIIVYILMGRDI